MEIVNQERKIVEVVKDIICDICGKSCEISFGSKRPKGSEKDYEYMTLEAYWGFGSTHDEEKWTAHVCNKCVDTKLSKLIKFKKEEYNAFAGMHK